MQFGLPYQAVGWRRLSELLHPLHGPHYSPPIFCVFPSPGVTRRIPVGEIFFFFGIFLLDRIFFFGRRVTPRSPSAVATLLVPVDSGVVPGMIHRRVAGL